MKTICTTLLAVACAAVTLLAADPIIGTWKMNLDKSKFSPNPAPKSVVSTYSQEGDWIVVKTTGTEADGRAINRTNRYKMDGKEYPWDGPQGKGTISIKKTDDHHAVSTTKFDGGHSVTSKTTISHDGKTRTMTTSGTNAKGQKVNSTILWERQ